MFPIMAPGTPERDDKLREMTGTVFLLDEQFRTAIASDLPEIDDDSVPLPLGWTKPEGIGPTTAFGQVEPPSETVKKSPGQQQMHGAIFDYVDPVLSGQFGHKPKTFPEFRAMLIAHCGPGLMKLFGFAMTHGLRRTVPSLPREGNDRLIIPT